MKQPKLNDLNINVTATKQIRAMAVNSKKIKITINIDKNTLDSIKELATKTGGSYQKILNELLKNGLEKNHDSENRLQKLEKEVANQKENCSLEV